MSTTTNSKPSRTRRERGCWHASVFGGVNYQATIDPAEALDQ